MCFAELMAGMKKCSCKVPVKNGAVMQGNNPKHHYFQVAVKKSFLTSVPGPCSKLYNI
jgi:hypothetical protein